MTSDSLRDTIAPKSDQLNADDLIAGPITVTVQAVKRGSDAQQPVSVDIGEGRQPYKPCKSMRRVLIACWGENGSDWVGKSMTLFCDPSVVYGGVRVGGIRISHVSDIDGDSKELMLTETRSKRKPFVVRRLELATPKAQPVTQGDVDKLRSALAAKGLDGDATDEWICDLLKMSPEMHIDATNWRTSDLEACRAKYKRDFSSKEAN